MRLILLVLAALLASCSTTPTPTLVSTELIAGYEYRPNPVVQVIRYSNQEELQRACTSVTKRQNFTFRGCGIVPPDPDGVCIIRIMRGDTKTERHERAHCYGYTDTTLPWLAHPDFN